MQFKFKLIAVAILAVLSGTAFAAPMLVYPNDVVPYPHVPEGPKAYMSVDIVYADFSVAEGERNVTTTILRPPEGDTWSEANSTQPFPSNFSGYKEWIPVNVTETVKETNITFTTFANITNLSDRTGYLYEAGFAAAQNIHIIDSALGGTYFNRNYPSRSAPSSGGIVNALYVDGKWLNTTWIPGKDYPFNVYSILSNQHAVSSSIPSLPENASELGTWIEGVPIAEYWSNSGLAATHIYINGAWVDVSGRVQPYNPQPMVMSTNTIANLIQTPGVALYSNTGNTSVGPVTGTIQGWSMGGGRAYNYIGGRGFDRAWLPHQSRLIRFNGTITLSGEYGNAEQIKALLENGSVDLYGSVTSYINNMPVNGVFTNTVYAATGLKTIQLQKTSDGYLYNAVLAPKDYFQMRPDGVEAYIKQVD